MWQDGAKARAEQSRLVEYGLVLGLAMTDGEVAALGSLHTSCHWANLTEQDCCSPLPLPRMWHARHTFPPYLVFFLPSAHKHKHHKLPPLLKNREWLYCLVFGVRTTSHTHCPVPRHSLVILKTSMEPHSSTAAAECLFTKGHKSFRKRCEEDEVWHDLPCPGTCWVLQFMFSGTDKSGNFFLLLSALLAQLTYLLAIFWDIIVCCYIERLINQHSLYIYISPVPQRTGHFSRNL